MIERSVPTTAIQQTVRGIFVAAALAVGLTGCASDPEPGAVALVEGFAGLVAADEPNAAVIGREILGNNGTAVDAAVAMGFALGVTLPSRAGLGGGGACLVFDRQKKSGEALTFAPVAESGSVPVPATARALALLHARYGNVRWELLLAPAEELARFGVPVSRALAGDVARSAAVIDADPTLKALFRRPGGKLLGEGDRLVQPELSTVMSGIRLRGGGYLYNGALPDRLEEAAKTLGERLPAAALRDFRARLGTPLVVPVGVDRLYLSPLPFDGGVIAGQLWQMLAEQADWPESPDRQRERFAAAFQRVLAARAAWGTANGESLVGEAEAKRLLAAASAGGVGAGPEAPGASFVVGDRFGNAVACSFTMNRLFGLGRVAPGTGLVLAAPPAGRTVPLGVALLGNENTGRVRYVAGASGGDGAGALLTQLLLRVEGTEEPGRLRAAVAEPRLVEAAESARAAAFYCPGGLHVADSTGDCQVASDPRGNGLAEIAQ